MVCYKSVVHAVFYLLWEHSRPVHKASIPVYEVILSVPPRDSDLKVREEKARRGVNHFALVCPWLLVCRNQVQKIGRFHLAIGNQVG